MIRKVWGELAVASGTFLSKKSYSGVLGIFARHYKQDRQDACPTSCGVLLLIPVIATLLFAGCGGDSDRQVSRPPSEVEQELSRFSLVHAREGRTKWKLNADVATFLESDRIRVEKVELLIFGDKEGETLTIHGDRGEVNQRTNNIKITGNVEGVSSGGGRLTADEIYWREGSGKIYTLPGVKVTITYEDSVIVGEELEADPELEIATLKNVTGVTSAEEKESDKPTEEGKEQERGNEGAKGQRSEHPMP